MFFFLNLRFFYLRLLFFKYFIFKVCSLFIIKNISLSLLFFISLYDFKLMGMLIILIYYITATIMLIVILIGLIIIILIRYLKILIFINFIIEFIKSVIILSFLRFSFIILLGFISHFQDFLFFKEQNIIFIFFHI